MKKTFIFLKITKHEGNFNMKYKHFSTSFRLKVILDLA